MSYGFLSSIWTGTNFNSSVTFASSLGAGDILEIDSLKIKPIKRGMNSIITIDYAIRKLGDKRGHDEFVATLNDTIVVHGTQLLAEENIIYDLSKGEAQYSLPLLSIIDDSTRPLIGPGDKLNISINDPTMRVKFKEPGYKIHNQQFDLVLLFV